MSQLKMETNLWEWIRHRTWRNKHAAAGTGRSSSRNLEFNDVAIWISQLIDGVSMLGSIVTKVSTVERLIHFYSFIFSFSDQPLYFNYLLTYAHRSQWSIGHQRPPAIALCSGLLWSFLTSWSPAVSDLLQCLASNCCEAGLSFSSPAGSRSGLGVCPIQPHFLRNICLATGSCPAHSHRSSFRIFSCCWIL